jgi:hypothetical protein
MTNVWTCFHGVNQYLLAYLVYDQEWLCVIICVNPETRASNIETSSSVYK